MPVGAGRGARSYDEDMDREVSGAGGLNPAALMVGRRSPALTEELWRLVRRAKRDDVLAPVTVVSPTRYASLSLRHELGRSGFANVRFIESPVISEMLGGPRLAREGRRPLTAVLESAFLRKIVAQAAQPLRQVSDHPAALASLRASFGELRASDDDVLEALERRGGLGAEIVRLYRMFRGGTTGMWYDAEDLMEAAADVVSVEGSLVGSDLGLIAFYLPRNPSPSETRLIKALSRYGRCAVLVGTTGDERADGPALELAEALGFAQGGTRSVEGQEGPHALPPGETRLHIAPNAHEELRWVTRRIVERAEERGTPFHKMAILYRVDNPYATLIPAELTLAGIPVAGPDRATLGDTAAGRTLTGLLSLSGGELGRAELMAWLTGCPVKAGGAGRAGFSPSRWDRLTKKAGIVGGLGEWRSRLTSYERSLAEEADRREQDGETTQGRVDGMRAEAAEAREALSFVEKLAKRLSSPGSDRPWQEYCEWALRLLDTYLSSETRGLEEMVARDGLDKVRRRVDELAVADKVTAGTTLGEFRRAVEDSLKAPVGHLGVTGEGVFVSSLAAASGMSFDALWMVGMIEGKMPPAVRPDPLLREPDLRGTGGRSRMERQAAADRYDYLSALAGSHARTLSYPAVDAASGARAYPSRWFLEQATALEGRPVHTSDIGDLMDRPWLTFVESGVHALAGAGEGALADTHDYNLARLLKWQNSGRVPAHHPLALDGPLARAARMGRRRRLRRLTEFDGNLSSAAATSRFRENLDRSAVSATSLESWAACPFRYFLGHVLRLDMVETPEEIMTISPLERGSLVHKILERFIRDAEGKGHLPAPGEGWGMQSRGRIMEIASEEFAAAEARGVTGKRTLWKLEKQDIEADLDTFLEEDAQVRSEHGSTSIRVEAAFGFAGVPQAGLELTDGTRIGFRGMADRLDMSADGSSVLVIDYKTGSARSYRELERDVIDRGKRLQLGIYSLAARNIEPAAERVRAAYWFATARGGFQFAPHSYLDMGDERANRRFREGVSTIVEGIRRGLFPANPGRQDRGRGSNCRFCDFDSLCPARRDEFWEAKRADPILSGYVALAGGDEEGQQ